MISADAATSRWVQAMGSAATKYAAGVNAVTSSPMQAAAKNAGAYVAGVQAAVASGKWQAGLARTTLQQWQAQCVNLGAQRIGAGASAAQPKMLAFMQQFLPYVANAQAQVKAMPNDTYEGRKARAMSMMDILHQFKRTK